LITHEYIKIGVTGHRSVEDEFLIRKLIRKVLRTLENESQGTAYIFIAISPIAEGSDRLVAEEILSFNDKNKLTVVLPLEREDYMNDFKTSESKGEFLNLLNQADEVINLPKTPKRKDAYLQVGKYVADNCDVLIAIWDGLPSRGKGGTAEIVDYARINKKPIYWINSVTGEINYLD